MEWLNTVIGGVAAVGTSAASGGVFGFLGALTGGVVKFFQRKQEMKHQQIQWDHELKLYEAEEKRNIREDEHEVTMLEKQGSWQGLGSSIEAEASLSKATVHTWVNDIRSLFRLLLTTGLIIVTCWIFANFLEALRSIDHPLGMVFTPDELKATLKYISDSLVFATSTAIVWWYGERSFTPPHLKKS